MSSVDLKGAPFHLTDDEEAWVHETLNRMSLEEKAGQLFFSLGFSKKTKDVDRLFETMQPGGMMYRTSSQKAVAKMHAYLQEKSKIPMLLAANLEAGGDGLVEEGTRFGNNMLIAAANDPLQAERLGQVCAKEAAAVGGNTAFAPVIDINYNFRNPITNTRSFGDDPRRVAQMGAAYIKGVHSENSLVTIKHFPGDGCDGRDQHLITTVNPLDVDKWMESFGSVYKECIKAGARGLMAGHIAFPAYIKARHPQGAVDPMIPASLSKTLLNDLLRGELGYNGLIMTDATLMTGFGQFAPREELVPLSIAAGNDMFLFNKNYQEDYQFMLAGIKKGVLTEERLNEALLRILAAKASMKLPQRKTLMPGAFDQIASPEHKKWAREAADKGVTLVRDDQNLLPLLPQKSKKIGVFALGREKTMMDLLGNIPGFKGFLIKTMMTLFGRKTQPCHQYFLQKLKERGFEPEYIDHSNPLVMMKDMTDSIETFKNKYDAVIYLINVVPMSNVTGLSVPFASPVGSDAPWFVKEVPTMTISLGSPYHDYDLGMIPTLVNAYMGSPGVVDAVIDKIMGKSEFKGTSPVSLKLKEFVSRP